MARGAEQCEVEGEAVDEPEEDLGRNNSVDETVEDFRGKDGMLLDKFRQVVEARGDGESQEGEAED